MKINDVRRAAYAMPLTNPAFPRGPYQFFDREYLIVTYRTDQDALRAVPEPLEVVEPTVKYEFIRMPDSTGFGDYTETGQVIPVRFRGEEGLYHLLADLPARKPLYLPEVSLRPRSRLPAYAGEASLHVIAEHGQAIDAIGIDQFTGKRKAKGLLPGHEGRDAFQHRSALVIVARQRDGQVVVAFGG